VRSSVRCGDTTFAVHDFGPNLKPTDEQRTRLCHDLGIRVSQGNVIDPTYPFTSAGLICSRVPKPSVILWVHCLSSDFRYSFDFMENKEYIAEAAEIAKQIVRYDTNSRDLPRKSGFEQPRIGASRGPVNLPQPSFPGNNVLSLRISTEKQRLISTDAGEALHMSN